MEFYGNLVKTRASTLFVTVLTLCGVKLHSTGVYVGVILSVVLGLPVFAFGSVKGLVVVKLIGSLMTLGISGAFALMYTREEDLIEASKG